MVEVVDAVERLRHIQVAVNVLDKKLSDDDFNTITGYIEGLCRHNDLPVVHEFVPPILQPHLAETQ